MRKNGSAMTSLVMPVLTPAALKVPVPVSELIWKICLTVSLVVLVLAVSVPVPVFLSLADRLVRLVALTCATA